jgi:hypothetical protein
MSAPSVRPILFGADPHEMHDRLEKDAAISARFRD